MRKSTRMLWAALAVAGAVAACPAPALAATGQDGGQQAVLVAQAEVVESGTWGTCDWTIDADGALVVHPGTGVDTGDGSPWASWSGMITSVRFVEEGGQKVVAPSRCAYLFWNFGSLTAADLSGLDTSGVTVMSGMFEYCTALPSINLSGWDTKSVTSMKSMFKGCESLASINLSGWDTKSVTSMKSMFEGCESLASINLSGWDTKSVTSMSYMFGYCESLASLNLFGWDTGSVTDMSYMFFDCASLTSIDVSGWDTGSVTNMYGMFLLCPSLASLDLSGWGTGSVTDMSYMFYRCAGLASLDVSGWDTSNVSSTDGMFEGCSSLDHLKVGSSYQIKDANMFPETTSEFGWWSIADGKWYSKDEVVSGRSGTADEYLARKDLGRLGATLTLPQGSYEPTGQAIEPAPTVKIGDEELVAGTDYDVSYEDNVEVGTATVTVTGKGEYGGTLSATFEIAEASPMSLDDATVTLSKTSYTYAGIRRKPTPTVTLGGKELVAGTDYDVAYRDNVNAGTATVTVTGRGVTGTGNYEGSKQVAFTIEPAALDTVNVSETSFAYDGNVHKPTIKSVYAGDLALSEADYTVEYSDENPKDVGTYTLTVTAKGNFAGSKSVTFKILGEPPAAPTGTGWRDLEGGGKGYAKDGSWVIGWFELNSAKYYFGTDARMYTGWSDIIVGDKTMHYYFNPVSGVLARGTWMDVDGKKYYFRPSGSMATGFAEVDDKGVMKKYCFDESGQMLTGWQEIVQGDKTMRYYFRPSGSMATGWTTIDGQKYWFRPSGNMATGFADVDDEYKRYFDGEGHMVTGWQEINGKTYYFRTPSGAMQTGAATIDGKEYTFSNNGVLQTSA